METKDGSNSFSQQQEFTRGRARGSHVVAPCAKLAKVIIASIQGVVSSITTPLVDVIGAIKPLCQRQGNWDHAKVIAFIKCKK
jgi:hypothetical protein